MRVGIVAPQREACGIADYTRELAKALSGLADIEYVTEPAGYRSGMNAVDLVHVQHEYFVFGGVAPWKNRFPAFLRQVTCPVVMTVHEIVGPAGSAAFKAAIRLTNRMAFRHEKIKRFIVHTNLDASRLAAIAAPERVRVIRLGVPQRMVLPPRDQAQRELGLEGRFVVTLFGFIARKKGHLAALEAMRDLPEDVTLLIAGGKHPDDATSYVCEVEERARELSVRARITGYLPADKIPTIMAATDLALAPFIETSGSASLAIAFASGRPIVASDIQPHREILQDTEYSLQLAAPEPGALARTILEIRHDARAIERLRAGSARYAETHSMARAAEETVRVYREALAEVSA